MVKAARSAALSEGGAQRHTEPAVRRFALADKESMLQSQLKPIQHGMTKQEADRVRGCVARSHFWCGLGASWCGLGSSWGDLGVAVGARSYQGGFLRGRLQQCRILRGFRHWEVHFFINLSAQLAKWLLDGGFQEASGGSFGLPNL